MTEEKLEAVRLFLPNRTKRSRWGSEEEDGERKEHTRVHGHLRVTRLEENTVQTLSAKNRTDGGERGGRSDSPSLPPSLMYPFKRLPLLKDGLSADYVNTGLCWEPLCLEMAHARTQSPPHTHRTHTRTHCILLYVSCNCWCDYLLIFLTDT